LEWGRKATTPRSSVGCKLVLIAPGLRARNKSESTGSSARSSALMRSFEILCKTEPQGKPNVVEEKRVAKATLFFIIKDSRLHVTPRALHFPYLLVLVACGFLTFILR
jgi:hypothetical protein